VQGAMQRQQQPPQLLRVMQGQAAAPGAVAAGPDTSLLTAGGG
jgi:hypothetical protein